MQLLQQQITDLEKKISTQPLPNADVKPIPGRVGPWVAGFEPAEDVHRWDTSTEPLTVLGLNKAMAQATIDPAWRGPILNKAHTTYRSVCRNLYQHTLHIMTKAVSWPPPKKEQVASNSSLWDAYTMNGSSIVSDMYFSEKQTGDASGARWTKQDINTRISQENVCGYYIVEQCEETMLKYAKVIRGQHGLVLGSQTPWAEAALLKHGASHVTTLEYLPIESLHPQISSMCLIFIAPIAI